MKGKLNYWGTFRLGLPRDNTKGSLNYYDGNKNGRMSVYIIESVAWIKNRADV